MGRYNTFWKYLSRLSANCPLFAGRLSVFCRPTVGRLPADCRFFVGQLSVVCRPTVGRLSANCRSFVGQLSVVCWPTVPLLSADCWPALGSRLLIVFRLWSKNLSMDEYELFLTIPKKSRKKKITTHFFYVQLFHLVGWRCKYHCAFITGIWKRFY